MTSETQETQNALTVVKDQLPATADGFDAAAADSSDKPMKGQMVKFDSGAFFLGKEKNLLKDTDRRFIAMDTASGWQFLKKDCPAEYSMRTIGEPKPPRPDSYADESEWPDDLNGKLSDPWKYAHFLYLLDPLTAETFTFSTSTRGGVWSLDDLNSQIKLMRRAQPNAVPIVELQSQPMPTRFGMKQRPWFKVTGWHIKATDESKLLTNDDDGGVPGTKVVTDMNDELPPF